MNDTIPRRFSVRDRHFNPAIGRHLRVSLNGAPVTKVIAYDIDAGTVLRFATNADGKIVIAGGQAKEEILNGIVAVDAAQPALANP